MVGPGKPGKHTVSAGTEAGEVGDSDHAVGAGAPGEAGYVCVCVRVLSGARMCMTGVCGWRVRVAPSRPE